MIARGDMKSLGEVWTEKPIDGKLRLINYSNRVMKGKGYPWYNPDYKIMRTLYNQVPRKLRNQIPAARSALWGIKMGDAAALPQRKTSPRRTAIRSSPKRTAIRSSSPALSARVARTYRTAQRSSPSIPKTASISEGRRQESARRKEELARQQSAKKKQEELARQQSAKKKQEELARQQSAKKKQEELARQQSAKKKQEELARQQSAKKKEEMRRQESAKKQEVLRRQESAKKKSATPRWMQKRSPQTTLSSPLRKLSNAERAAVYGQKRRSPNTAIADLQRRKADCQQRGLFYNPIIRTCVRTMKTPATPGRCREDCAAIGKRCGPKGRCVKL
jgi:hypothetical protein